LNETEDFVHSLCMAQLAFVGCVAGRMGRSKGGGKGGKVPGAASASSGDGRGFVAPPAVVGSLLGDAFRPSRKHAIEVEAVGPEAFVARGVLTPGECDAIRSAADARGYSHATSRGARYGEADRNHGRANYEDPSLANAIWERTGLADALVPILGPLGRDSSPTGLNPALRVYRYAIGEVFGAHYDDANRVAGGGNTEFTFLLYLTGEVVGGETVFYRDALLAHDDAKETFRVAPEAGKVLVFRHGARCPPHASLAVERGTKVVLRSDVVYTRR